MLPAAHLVAVFTGRPECRPAEPELGPLGREWTTAIFKRPVEGPIEVLATGLAGDQPADLARHGGPERALLAYPVSHYAFWRGELARSELPGAAFGENLAVAGCDEESVCIGDLVRVGTALVRVTQPRQPGWKLARRWGNIRLPKRMAAERRTGWYLAVERPGRLATGQPIELLERPCPEWPVSHALAVLYDHAAHRSAAPELFHCPFLGAAWKAKLAVRHPGLKAAQRPL